MKKKNLYVISKNNEEGFLSKFLIKCVHSIYGQWSPIHCLSNSLKRISGNKETQVEIIVVLSVVILFSVWLLMHFLKPPYSGLIWIPLWILITLLILRLTDILCAWIWVNIIARSHSIYIKDAQKHSNPSPIRLLLLTSINWLEIVFIFSILLTLAKGSNVIANFYRSISIMTLNWFKSPQSWQETTLFYAQLMFALLFIFIIIQRVLSLIRNRDDSSTN